MDKIQANTVYMRQDTRISQYLPYPQYLLTLDVSGTAKVLYALLLNRAALSQRNAWLDDEGNVYISAYQCQNGDRGDTYVTSFCAV